MMNVIKEPESRDFFVTAVKERVYSWYIKWKEEIPEGKPNRLEDFFMYTWIECASQNTITDDQIRDLILYADCSDYDILKHGYPVCFAYISGHRSMTEAFIKELMFLSCGVIKTKFDLPLYCNENIDIITDIISKASKDSTISQADYIQQLINKGMIEDKGLRDYLILNQDKLIIDRLDWAMMDMSKCSKKFKEQMSGMIKNSKAIRLANLKQQNKNKTALSY